MNALSLVGRGFFNGHRHALTLWAWIRRIILLRCEPDVSLRRTCPYGGQVLTPVCGYSFLEKMNRNESRQRSDLCAGFLFGHFCKDEAFGGLQAPAFGEGEAAGVEAVLDRIGAAGLAAALSGGRVFHLKRCF